MTLHVKTPSWSDASRSERIELIKAVLKPGMSMRQVADAVSSRTREPVSRNSIIGIMNRHKRAFDQGERPRRKKATKKPAKRRVSKAPEVKQKRQNLHAGNIARKRASRKLDPTSPDGNDRIFGPGVPMKMLGARQCRYAINNAEIGQVHLFCGRAVHEPGQPYCKHHAEVVVSRRQP